MWDIKEKTVKGEESVLSVKLVSVFISDAPYS